MTFAGMLHLSEENFEKLRSGEEEASLAGGWVEQGVVCSQAGVVRKAGFAVTLFASNPSLMFPL